MQALLARTTSLRTNDELITEQLRLDPAFRAEWERTALGRAAAVAMVHYRAEHDFSQQELAGLLGMTTAQIAELEVGDTNPSTDSVHRISERIGIALQ
jgi:DNA-binding XRE family transcriptional regulator